MSSISKMQIRGIRSFSPDRDETIEFYSPLTMIVGANGCGKTTIIESLKLATTGSLPPNTKGGSSIVNDPGLTDTTEVKAGIKLRFQNRSNRICVAVRSLQVLRKKTKLEFKALEGVLRTTDENNETVSISMKCSDMDRLIPENLGVSPAILENVIFLHQEDSNWPMQEGLVLKKKFDDVFESTRYTRALEVLSKSKKEFSAKTKELKIELAEYSAYLVTAVQTKKELAICEENKETCVKAIQMLTEKQIACEGKLKEANSKLANVKTEQLEIEKLQSQVLQKEAFIKDRMKTIETILPEKNEQLQKMLRNFEKVMISKQQQVTEIKQQIENLQIEISQLREINNQFNMKKGQAITFQDQLQSLQQQQVTSIHDLRLKYSNMPNPSASTTNWNIGMTKECIAILQHEYQQLSQRKENQMSTLRNAVDAIEREMNDVNTRISKTDVELRLKTEEIHSLTQESETKRMEMNKLSSSRTQVQRCEMEYQSALRSHDEFMETYHTKTADFKKQIKEVSDQIRDLQDRITQDTQLLQDLSHHRNELAALEGNMKQIESDLTSIQLELKSIFSVSNRDIIQEVSPTLTIPKTLPELDSFIKQFEAKYNQLNTNSIQSRELLNKLQSENAANDALLSQQQSVISKLQGKTTEYQAYEREMKQYITELNAIRNSKILSDCGFENISQIISIEELLIAAKVTEDEARELLVIAKSGRVFLKRMKKARAQNPNQCPCCGQNMATPAVQQEFEQRTKQLFPFADEESLGTVEEHKELLTQSTDIHEKIFILHQKMLPLVAQQLEMLKYQQLAREYQEIKEKKLKQISQQEKATQLIEQSLQQYQKVIRQFQDLSSQWKSCDQKKIDLLDRRKRQAESSLMVSSSTASAHYDLQTQSYEEIERLHHEHIELKDTLQLKKEKLTNDENNYQRKYFTIKSLLSEKEKSLSDAKLENNRILELENVLKSIEKKLEEIDLRKRSLQQDKKTFQQENQEITQRYHSQKQEYEKRENDWTQQLQSLSREKESLVQFYTQYEELSKKYQEINYTKIMEKLEENTRLIERQQEIIANELEPIYQQYQHELQSQEQTKRNIENNLELRQQEIELDAAKQRLAEKEEQFAGKAFVADLRGLEKEISKITKERETTLGECQHTKGQLEILEKQTIDLQNKLNSTTYRGIEEKHRKKLIELETTNLAVTDLDNYYSALDRALQDFHTLKIKEINKIIRELWQMIYQGQDIDTIEIQSGSDITDADGFAIPATVANNARSYNYRVVMKKGDVPLDMRGRCSAGQKVLAAIVIRLALAETFCLNCGILALDEPTTNLDEANKHGLAAALARLIIARSKQQNFQLICITHDEDFVQLIRTELSFSTDFNLPEYYFRVYRSEEGNSGRFFSHIERIPWEDM